MAVRHQPPPRSVGSAVRDQARRFERRSATLSLARSTWYHRRDPGSRRWYQVLLANDNVAERRSILLAWSRTADPTDLGGGWCRTAIPTGRLLDDYPKLGFSRHHVL